MKVSIVTDEISADPETAFELGTQWGVRDFELRGFGTDRVPLFSPYQKDRLHELLQEFNARVVAISPGLFKCGFPLGPRESIPLRILDHDLHRRWRDARDELAYHREELLPLSIEYSRQIGASLIVIFGFHRGDREAGRAPDEIVETLHGAAIQACKADVQLVLECEEGFWADTGVRTADVVRAVGHPSLAVNWDPSNAFLAGECPYPDGYRGLRGLVRHVHFKDVARADDGRYIYVENGEIDWAGQIAALGQDGYQGYISVETHMHPKVASAQAVTERLRRLIGGAMPDPGGGAGSRRQRGSQ